MRLTYCSLPLLGAGLLRVAGPCWCWAGAARAASTGCSVPMDLPLQSWANNERKRENSSLNFPFPSPKMAAAKSMPEGYVSMSRRKLCMPHTARLPLVRQVAPHLPTQYFLTPGKALTFLLQPMSLCVLQTLHAQRHLQLLEDAMEHHHFPSDS